MSFETLHVETSGGVATVTIDRPQALNALNRQAFAELDAAFSNLGRNDDVRAVVLTGAGEKAFAAGADIVELSTCDRAAAHELSVSGQAIFSSLAALPKPVIGAVNGFALGGGLELAMACTFRYAAEHAKLGLPEVKLGLIPGYGGTQRLARLVGPGRALEMILSGEFVGAEAAAAMGLVNRVVPAADLMPVCRALAEKIAAGAPLAVGRAIEAVHRGLDGTVSDGLALEADHFSALFETEDAREGIRAFLEKRTAEFNGV